MKQKLMTGSWIFLLALALVSCTVSTEEPEAPVATSEEVTLEPSPSPATTEGAGGGHSVAPIVGGEDGVSAASWLLSQGHWDTYTTQDGLPSDRIHTLASDAQGRLWVGTDRGGGWFDGATWEDVLPPPLALEDVTFDHQGQAWLADGRGVDVYDEGTLTTYGYDEGLSSIQTEALLVDSQGRVWVATETGGHGCIGGEGAAGINLFQEGEWTWVDTSDLFGPTILDLAEDASGDIWAVGDGGIARFDGAAWETMLLPAEEATQVVNCVAVDAANRVWFGAKQIGLWVWGGEEWTQYTTADGLAGETVWAIAFDAAGRTWAGTNGGLSVLEGESWISYTTDDGLAHNEVRALLITGDGVWVGTFRGLSHVVFDTGS